MTRLQNAIPLCQCFPGAYLLEERTVSTRVIEDTLGTPKVTTTTLEPTHMGLESRGQEESISITDSKGRYVPVSQEVTLKETEERVPKGDKAVEVPQLPWAERPTEGGFRQVPSAVHSRTPSQSLEFVPKSEIISRHVSTERTDAFIRLPSALSQACHSALEELEDVRVPVVIAQTVKHVVSKGSTPITVPVRTLSPDPVIVPVEVVTPVDLPLNHTGQHTLHKEVTPPDAQYNSILRSLNQHLDTPERHRLPFRMSGSKASFLDETPRFEVAHHWKPPRPPTTGFQHNRYFEARGRGSTDLDPVRPRSRATSASSVSLSHKTDSIGPSHSRRATASQPLAYSHTGSQTGLHDSTCEASRSCSTAHSRASADRHTVVVHHRTRTRSLQTSSSFSFYNMKGHRSSCCQPIESPRAPLVRRYSFQKYLAGQ
ncbi:MAG: hypothetical protein KVP17_003840 [Porospora cf. gigantea B]|uniref:uncharacterized protein n=1 Tax=Porospora cf. gigantea B TaxID=2853592 RepID=UPI0035717EF0|nr:MAG: hypothetical protein KVP17_003840 [Porospora cf. gigantea B]